MQWQIMSNLKPFVVSEFSSHSLIPTVGIVASVMSGVLNLPIAKLIDIWGRPQGLASMTALATVGLILMAVGTNIRMYATAEVSAHIRQLKIVAQNNQGDLPGRHQRLLVRARHYRGRYLVPEEPYSCVRLHVIAYSYHNLLWPPNSGAVL